MKTLYLILFFSSLLFAQYSNNKLAVPDFETPGGWNTYGLEGGETSERSSAQAHTGTWSWHINVDNDAEGARTATYWHCSLDSVYRVSGWIYNVLSQGTLYRNNGIINFLLQSTTATGSWQKVSGEYSAILTANEYMIIRSSGITECYFDDLEVRQKLYRIFINGSTGSDTNLGQSATPIATLDECDTRGYYDGGRITITAGTYAENWDIEQPVTITASGTEFTITQIDFNSTATSIDYYVYNGVATVLNDENVTIINTPVTDTGDKGFKETPKYKKFPDWR